MKIRSHVVAGQLASANTPSAQQVVNEMASAIQGDVKNLRIWSMIRLRGPGLSSWTFLSQNPESNPPRPV
jgi:hypothetical protein